MDSTASNDEGTRPMILIADAHVSTQKGNHEAFFAMLHRIAGSDSDVVFLGDIFDLWIALPAYEQDIHREFLAWCKLESTRRTVGYVEGNHEFFLAEEHGDCFSWCEPDAQRDEHGHLFVHGDTINHTDHAYMRFRRITKNAVSKAVMRWLPGGPRLAAHIKEKMRQRNAGNPKFLPETELAEFARRELSDRASTAFAGHFHAPHCVRASDEHRLHLIPDWQSTGQVARFDHDRRELSLIHWKELG